MRLLRLHDEAPDGALLELHPRMSVVTGLPAATRERVLAALAALPGGRGTDALTDISGTIESTGILLELDPATLALLDLTSDLDPVVRENDLENLGDGPLGSGTPVPAPPKVTLAQARQAQRNVSATHDALRRSLDALHEAHRRVLARRSVLASALTDLGSRPPTLAGRVERSVGEADQGRPASRTATVVLDGPGPTPEAVATLASAAARVDRLRTRRDETLAALEPFDDIDTASVDAALADAQGLGRAECRPDPEAERLADELAAALAALDAYDAALEAAGQGPVAAYKRLDQAQRWFLTADAAVRPPVIDPEAARELEAAHDEVQTAEIKLTASRMPSKNVKKRLDDAVEVEQQILAKMGFATYTSFVMSTTVPLVSPELRSQHEQAQAAFLQAEEAFLEAGAALEQDPERNALMAAVDAARERARALVGPVEAPDVERALRERTVVDAGDVALVEAAADRLRQALQEAGVDFGDLDLQPEEVAEVAEVWLTDMAEAAERRAELEVTLQELEDEIATVELELADVETAAPSLLEMLDEAPSFDEDEVDAPDAECAVVPLDDEPGDDFDEWQAAGALAQFDQIDGHGERESDVGDDIDDGARADLEEALAEVDAEAADLEEQMDAQGALVAAAAAGVEGATAQVAALEATERAGGDWIGQLAAADLDPPPEASGLAQVEWYLLARLAAQRSVSYAGSVPLVLDDPLARLAADEVDYVLERLLRMTDAVQVIYLGDDPRVIAWGRAAGDQVAMVAAG